MQAKHTCTHTVLCSCTHPHRTTKKGPCWHSCNTTHIHTHRLGSRLSTPGRPLGSRSATRPWPDHYFTLEPCTLRILTNSLWNTAMFNSIIITYFTPLADWKDEVCCNLMLGGPLWNLSAFPSLFLGLTSQNASAEKNITQTFIKIVWQSGTAASADEDSDGRLFRILIKAAIRTTKEEVMFNDPEAFSGLLREEMSKYRLKSDTSELLLPRAPIFGSICMQTSAFPYLEDGSQWAATCPEVCNVRTHRRSCFIILILSLEWLSTSRRHFHGISCVLWKPRRL